MEKTIDTSATYDAINANYTAFYSSTGNPDLKKPSRELTELASQLNVNNPEVALKQFENFATSDIIDYLEFNHHYYLTKKLPEIQQSIMHVFGSEEVSSLLQTLALFFGKYQKDLIVHIKMEENVFFPMVKNLVSNSKKSLSGTEQWVSFLEFMGNHDPIEEELQKVNLIIKEATKGMDLPFAYNVFMNQIELFEFDLRRHAIIEDEVLLPRVEAMMK